MRRRELGLVATLVIGSPDRPLHMSDTCRQVRLNFWGTRLISTIRKLSRLGRLNLAWLSSSHLSWGTRMRYYPSVVLAMSWERITGKKVVRYLGRPFYYDSPITPLLLLQYPDEIQDRILSNATGNTESSGYRWQYRTIRDVSPCAESRIGTN